jgi:hypothetical protein
MAYVLIRSGWLGRNTREWYENSGDLGDHITGLADELSKRGHKVKFTGSRGAEISEKPDLEIHIEKQFSFNACPKIAIFCEPSFVQPQNAMPFFHKYNHIYRMDSLATLKSYEERYWYPRNLFSKHINDWFERDIFISSISSNKNAVFNSVHSLYGKRNALIKQFDDHFGTSFHLYGGGWELRDHPVGVLAKILFRIRRFRFLLKRSFPLVCYKGKCLSKSAVMQRSKFYLCVENTQYPGCLTEKIIDCLSFGCVPVYLGPADVDAMIDPLLYIDIRAFDNTSDIFTFLKSFTPEDYAAWLERLELKRREISIRHSVPRFVGMVSDRVEQVLYRTDIE